MIKIFILEDDDNRIRQFRKNFTNAELTITKNSKDAIKILRKQLPYDYLFLDHDLGDKRMTRSDENTGYEVAQWLSKNALKKPKLGLYIHSLNTPGAKNMRGVLGYGSLVPFV